MKRQILIIEDNYYKFFTMKQVIETHLRLKVNVVGANNEAELRLATGEVGPGNIIIKPEGGVVELIENLRKRRLNRRNSEVTFVITPELDRMNTLNLTQSCLATAA